MAIFDLYSKRNKVENDIYEYEIISKLRIQINYIIKDFLIKNELKYSRERIVNFVYEALTREHAKQELYYSPIGGYMSEESQIEHYILEEKNNDFVIDAIEICFKCISKINIFTNGTGEYPKYYDSENAIADLNTRFRENGIGYRFENNMIIKIDNELLHNEITKPTLSFLSNEIFKTVNEEYLKAHEHFKNGNFKEAIVECLKSFESTIKMICEIKGWNYNQKDTSSKLIQIIFDNELVPDYMQTKIKSLRSLLESSIPTIRNRTSSHGQGVQSISVDESLASYTINITGSTIKFLIELIK